MLKTLQKLTITDCPDLSTLPQSLGHLSNLKILHLSHLALRTLPRTLSNLKNLSDLILSDINLFTLPIDLEELLNRTNNSTLFDSTLYIESFLPLNFESIQKGTRKVFSLTETNRYGSITSNDTNHQGYSYIFLPASESVALSLMLLRNDSFLASLSPGESYQIDNMQMSFSLEQETPILSFFQAEDKIEKDFWVTAPTHLYTNARIDYKIEVDTEYNVAEIFLDPNEANNNPEAVLLKLAKHFYSHPIDILRVDFQDQANTQGGLDVGGLTRIFVAQLIRGFIDSQSNFLQLNKKGLPYVSESLNAQACAETVGQLIGLSLSIPNTSERKFKIGSVFNEALVTIIKQLPYKIFKKTYPGLREEEIAQLYCEVEYQTPHVRDLKDILNAESLTSVQTQLETYDASLREDDNETFDIIKQNIQESMVESVKRSPGVYQAVHAIGRGIYQYLQKNARKHSIIDNSSADELNESIQGFLTKEAFFADSCFKFQSNNLSANQKERIKNYFKAWVSDAIEKVKQDNHHLSEEEAEKIAVKNTLERLLIAATGSPTITSNGCQIRPVDYEYRNRLAEFHTCFNYFDLLYIDLIDGSMTQEAFITRLEENISSAIASGVTLD